MASTPVQLQLGRYALKRRIATGGMGEVYLAEVQGAANFSRRVAIKRILPHLAQDEAFVRKFIDEANIMVQLHHGNIVSVEELSDHDGELYIVMEYLPGRDLKAVNRTLSREERVFPPELAAWVTTEICAGLDYAHRKVDQTGNLLGIVHRDVSPSNILLGAGGEVKITDFGIARARGGLHQSVSGMLQGKFVYMSPEQADGKAVDGRSDVFSAGLVLYEMLTGVRPFSAESDTETLRRARTVTISPPSEHTTLDPALDALVMKALERDPADRFSTAGDMRLALQHYLADLRSRADASGLASFLAELYPEGVIPPAEPPAPVSLDDALLQQLGALTPSLDPLGRTRTQTGPKRAAGSQPSQPSQPSLSLPSFPGSSFPGANVSGMQPALPPRRPWKAALAALAALLLVGSAATWAFLPKEATLEPRVTNPQAAKVEFSVMGTRLTPGARFEAGKTVRLCATAEGFEETCEFVHLELGQNRPALELTPLTELRPLFDPPGLPVQVKVNGLPAAFPMPVRAGSVYVLQVEAPAGWIVDPVEQAIRAEEGQNAPQFKLVRVEVPVADAGVPDAAPDAAPEPRPAVERRAGWTELSSVPSGAKVECGGRLVGPTPARVKLEGTSLRCELTYPDYASESVVLLASQSSRKVALLKLATLTVRASPGAARLFVDGRPVSNPATLPVRPGTHRVVARLESEGLEAERTVEIGPGEAPPALVLELPTGGTP